MITTSFLTRTMIGKMCKRCQAGILHADPFIAIVVASYIAAGFFPAAGDTMRRTVVGQIGIGQLSVPLV